MFSVQDAAEYLGVSESTIYWHITKQKLHSEILAGMYRIPQSELDAYRASHPKRSRPGPGAKPRRRPAPKKGDDTLLLSNVLVALFNNAGGCIKQVTSVEEVKPEVRVWCINADTTSGASTYQVIFDGIRFWVHLISGNEEMLSLVVDEQNHQEKWAEFLADQEN